jgi:hypothetical protein
MNEISLSFQARQFLEEGSSFYNRQEIGTLDFLKNKEVEKIP